MTLARFPEHAPEPATLDDVLEDVLAALLRFVVFPSETVAQAVALWIAATHGQQAWQHATRMVVNSPQMRCGKSRLLDLVEALCHRPLVTVNASVAAIFRSIDPKDPPTLIFDEADAIFGKKNVEGTEELRGLLNAGFQRNRNALRCVGPMQTPTEFPTYAMAVLAAIGDAIPGTVTDRAAPIVRLNRRAPGETVASYRHRRDAAPLRELGDRLGNLIRANVDVLGRAEPAMPVEDRAADAWEPLVAVADLAGGPWPKRARNAAQTLTAEADAAAADESLGMKLLTDLRVVFARLRRPEASSAEIVGALCALPESPWQAFQFTQNDLARRLKPYGVKPDRVRPDGPDSKQVRGYRLDELVGVFDRYLPAPDPDDPDQALTPSQAVNASQAQVAPVTPPSSVTPQGVTSPEGVTGMTRECDAMTLCDGPPGGNGHVPADDLGARSSDTYEQAGT